jgi:stearoyl-CoA desaturase (delta-9 desaturase)
MSATAVYPWEQPIWKPAPGKTSVLLYLITIHLLAAVGLVLYPLPSGPVLLLALAAAMWGGLGTTVCFHRSLSHRTVKLHSGVEHFLILGAMFNGSGSPLCWVANHRHHHLRSDTDQDISSPHHGGFWWAHLRWLYQAPHSEVSRWCPEMDTPKYRVWEKLEIPAVALGLLWGAALGWEGFFWMGAIRMVYSLHLQCAVNSITHLGPARDGDHSQNVWWLGPLQITAWGENWHRNHHDYSGSARFGWRWWQVDIGWYAIRALEAVGLASQVRGRVPESPAA